MLKQLHIGKCLSNTCVLSNAFLCHSIGMCRWPDVQHAWIGMCQLMYIAYQAIWGLTPRQCLHMTCFSMAHSNLQYHTQAEVFYPKTCCSLYELVSLWNVSPRQPETCMCLIPHYDLPFHVHCMQDGVEAGRQSAWQDLFRHCSFQRSTLQCNTAE